LMTSLPDDTYRAALSSEHSIFCDVINRGVNATRCFALDIE